MARAISSFPVPVSPSMRAVELVGATIRTRSNTSRRALLAPTMSSKPSITPLLLIACRSRDATVENNAEEVDSAVPRAEMPTSYPRSVRQASTSFRFSERTAFPQAMFVPPLFVGPSVLLPQDPLADECRAILELDAVRFAALKKADGVLIHQRQVFQIQDDAATARFCADQRFQLGYVFCPHSTAQLKPHPSVRCPRDLQHPPSPENSYRCDANHTCNGNHSSNVSYRK